jgi:hypothetical protein
MNAPWPVDSGLLALTLLPLVVSAESTGHPPDSLPQNRPTAAPAAARQAFRWSMLESLAN